MTSQWILSFRASWFSVKTAFHLQYENIMTKTQAIIMIAIAWVLAASTLPMFANSELDVQVEDMHSWPYSISTFIILSVVRVFTGFTITGFVIYLYWSTFRAKWKLRYLVMDSHTPSNTVNTFYAQMKKDKSLIHLSITQLLLLFSVGFWG